MLAKIRKEEKGRKPANAWVTGVAIAIWIIFGAGCAAASHPVQAPVTSHPTTASQSAQLPTAKDIAVQHGATKFAAGKIGPVPNAIEQTSTGTFFVGKKFYWVNTFVSKDALNAWLKANKPESYGIVPKWQGETWIVQEGKMPQYQKVGS